MLYTQANFTNAAHYTECCHIASILLSKQGRYQGDLCVILHSLSYMKHLQAFLTCFSHPDHISSTFLLLPVNLPGLPATRPPQIKTILRPIGTTPKAIHTVPSTVHCLSDEACDKMWASAWLGCYCILVVSSDSEGNFKNYLQRQKL